jgi:hypothetical protein
MLSKMQFPTAREMATPVCARRTQRSRLVCSRANTIFDTVNSVFNKLSSVGEPVSATVRILMYRVRK